AWRPTKSPAYVRRCVMTRQRPLTAGNTTTPTSSPWAPGSSAPIWPNKLCKPGWPPTSAAIATPAAWTKSWRLRSGLQSSEFASTRVCESKPLANSQTCRLVNSKTMQNQAAIERIIDEITREVLLRLNQPQPTSGASGCNCTDGSCVQNCADKVNKVVQAGASRVTATLGVRPQDNGISRYIDHTQIG